MSDSLLLGKLFPASNVTGLLATVPNADDYASITINAVNTGSVNAYVSIYVTSAPNPINNDLIESRTLIPASGVLERTCVLISSGENIFVKSDVGGVVFRCYGVGKSDQLDPATALTINNIVNTEIPNLQTETTSLQNQINAEVATRATDVYNAVAYTANVDYRLNARDFFNFNRTMGNTGQPLYTPIAQIKWDTSTGGITPTIYTSLGNNNVNINPFEPYFALKINANSTAFCRTYPISLNGSLFSLTYVNVGVPGPVTARVDLYSSAGAYVGSANMIDTTMINNNGAFENEDPLIRLVGTVPPSLVSDYAVFNISVQNTTGSIATLAFNNLVAIDKDGFNLLSNNLSFRGRLLLADTDAGIITFEDNKNPDNGTQAYNIVMDNGSIYFNFKPVGIPFGSIGKNLSPGSPNTKFNFVNNGTAYAYNWAATSDDRYKSNWKNISDTAIYDISNIKSGTFNWLPIEDEEVLESRQVGVSAQDLEKIIPEAISENIAGRKHVAYGQTAMVLLVQASKELKKLSDKIEEQDKIIYELKTMVEGLINKG